MILLGQVKEMFWPVKPFETTLLWDIHSLRSKNVTTDSVGHVLKFLPCNGFLNSGPLPFVLNPYISTWMSGKIYGLRNR